MRKFERDRKESETDRDDGLKAPVPFRDEKELMEHHKKKTKGVIIDKGSDKKGELDELIDQEFEQKKLEEEKEDIVNNFKASTGSMIERLKDLEA